MTWLTVMRTHESMAKNSFKMYLLMRMKILLEMQTGEFIKSQLVRI